MKESAEESAQLQACVLLAVHQASSLSSPSPACQALLGFCGCQCGSRLLPCPKGHRNPTNGLRDAELDKA